MLIESIFRLTQRLNGAALPTYTNTSGKVFYASSALPRLASLAGPVALLVGGVVAGFVLV